MVFLSRPKGIQLLRTVPVNAVAFSPVAVPLRVPGVLRPRRGLGEVAERLVGMGPVKAPRTCPDFGRPPYRR